MRHYKSYITMALAACTLSFASCSDEYMENMNTDPSKAATIDPNAQLTTAQLHTYGDLEVSETYRSYSYSVDDYDPVGIDKDKKEISDRHSHNSIFVVEMPRERNGFKPKLCAAYYGRTERLEESWCPASR